MHAGAATPRPDLIVSTNDAKYQRVVGTDTYPADAPSDSLDLIDAGVCPPRLLARVDVAASIVGPPQAVALTPDGRLGVVSAPSRYDRAAGQCEFGAYLQLVDFAATPPAVVQQIPTSAHPQGLAISSDGRLLLAATVGGTVDVFRIEAAQLQLHRTLQVCSGRLSGIAFTPDDRAALVLRRDNQGAAVLAIDTASASVELTDERISTGVAPYALDMAGRWAVVGNVGLAGLAGPAGQLAADVDTLTLIDIAQRPFRAVQHLSVPALPEGVAISPDGRWLAALTMDGSNLPVSNPSRRPHGQLAVFEIRDGQAHPAALLPAGEGGQGAVFSADSQRLLAQFNVEHQLAAYGLVNGQWQDTGERLAVRGGPSSIRAMPGRRG